MLTIQNKDKIAQTEFHCNGVEWIVYGVDEADEYYNILFMPKVNGVFEISKYKSVKLSRVVKSLGHYQLHSTSASTGRTESFIPTSDIKKPMELLKFISINYLVYHNI
jgi:hypothetical protein